MLRLITLWYVSHFTLKIMQWSSNLFITTSLKAKDFNIYLFVLHLSILLAVYAFSPVEQVLPHGFLCFFVLWFSFFLQYLSYTLYNYWCSLLFIHTRDHFHTLYLIGEGLYRLIACCLILLCIINNRILFRLNRVSCSSLPPSVMFCYIEFK
jgi:hypothetical protein